MNDIPMLKIAGVAAVMDNAYEEVKSMQTISHHLMMNRELPI